MDPAMRLTTVVVAVALVPLGIAGPASDAFDIGMTALAAKNWDQALDL